MLTDVKGSLTIYELVAEDSAVSYWEKFGTIAFDTSQKAMLTSCNLKNPDPKAPNKLINCCFSFTIRRDAYDMYVSARHVFSYCKANYLVVLPPLSAILYPSTLKKFHRLVFFLSLNYCSGTISSRFRQGRLALSTP